MKIDRNGQSEIIDKRTYGKIRAAFLEPSHQLILDLAFYTGERWGAIVQLKIADVFDERGRVRAAIVYRKQTRKDQETREVPVSDDLRLRLSAYDRPSGEWLFPGRLPGRHLTIRAADYAFRRALERAGLDGLGYSTHGTRRGLITALDRNGTSIKVIQSITGHKSLAALSRYIEVSTEQKINALAAI